MGLIYIVFEHRLDEVGFIYPVAPFPSEVSPQRACQLLHLCRRRSRHGHATFPRRPRTVTPKQLRPQMRSGAIAPRPRPAIASTDCLTMRLVRGYRSALSPPSSSPVARNVNSASVNWACDISQRARCANSDGTRISQRRASPNNEVSLTTSTGTPSARNRAAIVCAEGTSEKVATTSHAKFEVDDMISSNY
jgi:hypothetical protein